MTRLLGILLSLLVGLACPAFAEDKPVQFIHLLNKGAYVISPIELAWKTPAGKRRTYILTTSISKNEAWCLDLKKFGLVEEGSEVWIHPAIVLGETQTCRSGDSRRVYSVNGETAFWRMGGETLTNNRCKSADKAESWDAKEKGNSGQCHP